jgi:N-acetylglucosamine-6-sulfatase
MAAAAISRRSILTMPLLAAARQPNVVFILVDDLRWDELRCTGHPFASTPNADRLAREGALFANAFAVTPLCSPSRANFLTGLYTHRHGITDNTSRAAQSHRLDTWPRRLHENGYTTAFLGKWHMGNDDSPRPGFDHWVSFPGQGECVDPVLNVNGRETKNRGYITDLLTDHATAFLERQTIDKPFCLYLSHKAIHPNVVQRDDGSVAGSISGVDGFIPAGRHKNLYRGQRLPRRENFGKAPRGKPALERRIGDLPPLGAATVTPDETILNRMRMMKAVDEGLGRIMAVLEDRRLLDETLLIFTSDHGYFYGEHGLDAERRLAYEETIRIPLLMRYPKSIPAGSRIEPFALSIDIAPTVLELAGPQAASRRDGRSLTPLFASTPRNWRNDFLIEYYSDTVFPRILKMGYRAVRNQRWKYIQFQDLEGCDELYDLESDPFEMTNLIRAPQAHGMLARMRGRLQALRENGRRG